jgi:phage terminase large subunit-like protein
VGSRPDPKALARFTPEQQKKIRRLLKLERQRDKAKEQNPIGFYRPLPTQLKFHKSKARKRLITGGNRSGKTEGGASELIYWVRGHSPYREIPKGPLGIVASSLSFDLARATVVEAIERLMPERGIELLWSRDEKHLKGPNGKVTFKSDEQGWKSYQGRALDAFWLDEEHSFEVYRQLCKRLKAGSKIESWYTMTAEPDVPDHWTYEELAQKSLDDPEVDHFELSLDENRISNGGYIADEEIDNLIANTPVEERPAVIHGKYIRRGGLMYPMWDRDVHMIPEVPLRTWLDRVRQGIWTPFGWLDWGVRNPTAIGIVVVNKDKDLRLIGEIYRPAHDVRDIKQEYQKQFATLRPNFIAADPSIWHNHDSQDPSKTVAAQFEREDPKWGLSAIPLIKGDNDHTNGHAAVRELLSVHPEKGPRFKVQENCVDFIREIESYVGDERATRAAYFNKKETARRHKDHHMDGFRYLALSPYDYIKPRRFRHSVPMRGNPVTGYVRAGVAA